MKKGMIFVGVIVIIIAIVLLGRSGSQDLATNDIVENVSSESQENVSEENVEAEVGAAGEPLEVDTTMAGSCEAWSPEKLALATENDVVIFFHASWCPSCRALDKNIQESQGDIPADLVILKADYDTETEMKRQYGVTTQHTLVQVDANGSMITKWSGGSQLADIIEKLQ